MDNFTEWLNDQLKMRGWINVDLARAARISESQISRVISGGRQPGPDFCTAVARGLGLDPVLVFRNAGLLPEADRPEDDPSFQEMYSIMKQLKPALREEVIAYAIWRQSRQTDE